MSARRLTLLVTFVLILSSFLVAQNTISVPTDQPTIQSAIDAANTGDLILVDPGYYSESLNFHGKAITVRSAVPPDKAGVNYPAHIIGNQSGSIVVFNSGETASSVLDGFIIQLAGPDPTLLRGAGIYIDGASPTIQNNYISSSLGCQVVAIFANNSASVIKDNVIGVNGNQDSSCIGDGAGVVISGHPDPSTPGVQLINNNIWGNFNAGGRGSGVLLDHAGTVSLIGNRMQQNQGTSWSGVYISGSNATLTNNLITDNSGGVYINGNDTPSVSVFTNNTIANNNYNGAQDNELTFNYGSTLSFSNNIIAGAWQANLIECFGGNATFANNDVFAYAGNLSYCGFVEGRSGNVSVDPAFIGQLGYDPPNYTLQDYSPLLDAGNNDAPGILTTDFEGKPRIIDNNNDGVATADMGAFEYQAISVNNPGSYDFGDVLFGTSVTQQFTLTATRRIENIQFRTTVDPFQNVAAPPNPNDIFSSSDCPCIMNAGDACTLTITYNPSTANTEKFHVVVFGTNADDTSAIAVSGKGHAPVGTPQLSSSSIDLGDIVSGTAASQSITLTNTGSGTLYISQIQATTPFQTSNDCGNALNPQSSCTISVSMYGNSVGTFSGTLSVQTWNSTNSYSTVPLHANVVMPYLSVTSSTVTFNRVLAGTTATQTVTLSNPSASGVTINQITPNPSGVSDLVLTNACPTYIQPGASCALTFTYKPTAHESVGVVYSIYNSGINSPQQINVSASAIISQITASPSTTSYSLGKVLLGSQVTKTIQLINSGDLTINFGQIALSGTDYSLASTCGTSLAVGASCNLNVTFQPSNRATETASLVVPNDVPNGNLTFSFTGDGIINQMSASPAQITFANQLVNTTSAAQTVTVSNSGDVAFTLTSGMISTLAPFKVVSNNCVTTLQPGATCSVSVSFTPTSSTSSSGALLVQLGSPNSATVTLNGTGIAPIANLSSSSVTFGDQQVGSTSSQSVTLTNSGTAAMHISSISTANSAFTQTSNCGTTLAIGASCTIGINFTPDSANSFSDSLTIVADTVQPSTTVGLTGRGVQGAPSLSSNAQNLGNQNIGTSSAPYAITLTNSGTGSLGISSIAIAAPFAQTNSCPASLAPGANCAINVVFSPTTRGVASSSLTVSTNGGPATITSSFSGTGTSPSVSVSPNPLSFGSVLIGNSANRSVTLTNTGDGPLTISQVAAQGSGFTFSNGCAGVIQPSNSCSVAVVFQPTAHANYSGNITFQDDASGSPQVVNINGTGVAPVASLNATSVNFGSVAVGSVATSNVILTNSGDANLNIGSIAVTGAGLSQSNNCSSSLVPNSSCTIAVSFAPTTTGAASGSLSISDDAAPGTQSVSLNGTGIAPTASFSPSPVVFANLVVGSTSAATNVTLQNTGSLAMSISSIAVSGDYSQTNNCPASLAVGAKCTVAVKFTPTGSGLRSGNLMVTGNLVGGSASVPLSGTGLDFAISAAPSALTVARKGSGTTTVSLTSLGGTFPSSVSLSCSNLPASTTCTFSPSSIAVGGTSSTLTIKPAANAVVGAYTITVKGVSGSLTRTSNITLTIQ